MSHTALEFREKIQSKHSKKKVTFNLKMYLFYKYFCKLFPFINQLANALQKPQTTWLGKAKDTKICCKFNITDWLISVPASWERVLFQHKHITHNCRLLMRLLQSLDIPPKDTNSRSDPALPHTCTQQRAQLVQMEETLLGSEIFPKWGGRGGSSRLFFKAENDGDNSCNWGKAQLVPQYRR